MIKGQIKSVMEESLVKFSKELNIPIQDFRIKMKLDESLERPICIALNKTTEIKNLEWRSILGFLRSAFEGQITSFIADKLSSLSNDNNLDKKDVNIRFYAVDMKGTSKMHFYNGVKPIKEISIDEFI